MPAGSCSYPSGSVFTVNLVYGSPERLHEVQAGGSDAGPNHASFDLAVVQFNDDGTFVDANQIDAACTCIDASRLSARNGNGALVIVFVHGWHHGAGWNRSPSVPASDRDGDDHFHGFRLVLESLALREAERYGDGGIEKGRRVVGVYLSWNGDPEGSLISKLPLATHGTFWDRYAVAEKVGASVQFRDALRRIIGRTKEPVPVPGDGSGGFRPESPLVMIGHSMGALMLQSGFAALLEDRQQPLARQTHQAGGAIEIRRGGERVSFPDLVLSLNSAADSGISRRIGEALERLGMTRTAAAGSIRYAPPLLMSVTSTGDADTRVTWPIAKPGRVTDGNDGTLLTHSFLLDEPEVACMRGEAVDLGQNWHCLRVPQPPSAATPAIPIDLPVRERKGVGDVDVPHARYMLAPKGRIDEPRLIWLFQVPPEVIGDHNDIFNSRARSLVLALIQISGAVASIAEHWEKSFDQ